MNTAGVIARVQSIFGDANGVFITNTHIVDWINNGQLEIARETQYKISTDASTYQANDFIAGVNITTALLIKKIKYDTRYLALIDSETPDRMSTPFAEDENPRAYYIIGQSIFLYPAPASTDVTQMTVTFVSAPTDLASEASALDIPVRFHNDLCNFVIGRAHERNENWRAAEYYEQKFRASLAQRKFESMSGDDSFYSVGPDALDHDDLLLWEI